MSQNVSCQTTLITMPRVSVGLPIGDVVGDADVHGTRHQSHQKHERGLPQVSDGPVERQGRGIETGERRDNLVLPPLLTADRGDHTPLEAPDLVTQAHCAAPLG